MSRSPLPETPARLEAEGMLVLHTRRGSAVAELQPDEINEVFELRVLLVSYIAKQMCQISESTTDRVRLPSRLCAQPKFPHHPPDK